MWLKCSVLANLYARAFMIYALINKCIESGIDLPKLKPVN